MASSNDDSAADTMRLAAQEAGGSPPGRVYNWWADDYSELKALLSQPDDVVEQRVHEVDQRAGWTPIHMWGFGDPQTVNSDALSRLISLKGDPNIRAGGEGKTALHEAIWYNKVENARILLDNGASTALVVARNGKLPREIAESFHGRDSEICNMLVRDVVFTLAARAEIGDSHVACLNLAGEQVALMGVTSETTVSGFIRMLAESTNTPVDVLIKLILPSGEIIAMPSRDDRILVQMLRP